jgi:hypothetical protein
MEATPAGVAALRAGRLSPRVMRWSSREAEATLLSSHLTSAQTGDGFYLAEQHGEQSTNLRITTSTR